MKFNFFVLDKRIYYTNCLKCTERLEIDHKREKDVKWSYIKICILVVKGHIRSQINLFL